MTFAHCAYSSAHMLPIPRAAPSSSPAIPRQQLMAPHPAILSHLVLLLYHYGPSASAHPLLNQRQPRPHRSLLCGLALNCTTPQSTRMLAWCGACVFSAPPTDRAKSKVAKRTRNGMERPDAPTVCIRFAAPNCPECVPVLAGPVRRGYTRC
ncbi:hypothetical protein B0H14DRAFT_966554 [Mycena olivaceomarginata]|nr:hypothetical protein B0H14DRAFT_966554 [Mycena olivaceomarginata]